MSDEQARHQAAAPRRGPAPMAGPMRFMGGGPVEKSANFKGTAKRMFALIRPQRGLMAGVLLLGSASVALAVTGPKLLGDATNKILGGATGLEIAGKVGPQVMATHPSKAQVLAQLSAHGGSAQARFLAGIDFTPGVGIDFSAVGSLLGWVALIYLVGGIFGIFQGRLATRIVQSVVYHLRQDVESKLSRLPLKYFDQQPRGEVLSRVTNDIDNIAQSLQQSMSQIVTSLLTIIGVLAMMFWISPWLALIALVSVPISILVATRVGKRAQPQFVAQWKTTGRLNAHIEEMYTGHALVKSFGRAEESAELFHTQNEQLFKSSFRAQFVSGLIQPAMLFVSNLNYVAIAVVGGLQVASGSLSLGSVQAFIQYSRQFSQPLTQVASMANLVQSGVASAERVFELLDAPEQAPDPASPVSPADLRGRVAFENVSFRYLEDKPLIDDLSLVAEPGHTVAIVGPTGAGKTTLVNLLMRFYETNGGRITLDGVNVSDMSREQLRAQIGMVLQDTWLFGGSIADNIAYGSTGATRDQVVAAAKAAYVDRFVRALPDGYDTLIDDEGGNVSAGEKQLITIARAFLAEPSILVLDEATSSVDTRTEVLIQQAMATLRSGRTAFVIAHRLSTIRDADTILVMEGGQIVEQGSHHELLGNDGAYAKLYSAQFAAATAEVD
ncbi:MAG TPA: ABC transporter ATP-binding protein [Actinocrinis sp.]|nr:ABC transporter ATP-binding protein [Actinocrinis sp.]